jgi:hypothetical protein
MKQTQKLMNVHERALTNFTRVESTLFSDRVLSKTDRRFYSIAGAMWEGSYGLQFENRPRMEFNKIHLSIIRIFNEYRNNQMTVNYIPRDDSTLKQKLSDTLNDMYRACEQDSNAKEAYDNAFEEAVGGGIGAFRLVAREEDEYDEDNEHQKIFIEPIYDADSSVYWNLDAKRKDKSDATECWVLSSMTTQDYEDKWGEYPGATWPKSTDVTRAFDWVTPDVVYIAEYFEVEDVKEKVYVFLNMDGDEERYTDKDFEANEQLYQILIATGFELSEEKYKKRRRVHKYIMDGSRILEDCGYVAGRYIPIIPVYGKRWFIDNVERFMGHVRLSKDAMRLFNMQMSKLAEMSAYSSVEKPIFTPDQVAGHELRWSNDNIENLPYQLINDKRDLAGNPMNTGAVGYTRVPNVPPAMAAALQISDSSLKEILGNQENGEEIVANTSGKAVELVQNRIDMQSFIYMDNMSDAIRQAGVVFQYMAQDVYVENRRKIKTVGKGGDISTAEIMKPVVNEETGVIEYENDLSQADFDVFVDVGPTSSSKRSATVRALTGMMQFANDPETSQILSSVAMMNMDGEGLEDLRGYFRNKAIKLGAIRPSQKEKEELDVEMQNQAPDPMQEYIKAASEEAQAKAAQSRATTVKTIAEADEARAHAGELRARTVSELSEIGNKSREAMLLANKLSQNPAELAEKKGILNVPR